MAVVCPRLARALSVRTYIHTFTYVLTVEECVFQVPACQEFSLATQSPSALHGHVTEKVLYGIL